MQEFARLAAEVADYEAFERHRNGQQAGSAAHLRPGSRYAAALRVELVNMAAMIAAAASLANAMEQGDAVAGASGALAIYVPPYASSLSAAAERLLAEGADPDLCGLLQAYAARLQLAQRMSQAFVAEACGVGPRGLVDAEVLADAWRRTCEAAAGAIAAVGRYAGSSGPGAGADDRILDLLARARAGGTPCLDYDGRVTIPGWAERRREPRYETFQPATAVIGRDTVPVTIRDASASGLGIDLPRGAVVGDRLTLALVNGRQISGTVVWAVGRRAGLRLETKLARSDPLLARALIARAPEIP